MITTRQMIALGARFATLTLFATRQLFEAAMQFFDLLILCPRFAGSGAKPRRTGHTHVVRVLSDLRGHSLIWAIGNHPVNPVKLDERCRRVWQPA